MHWVYLVCSCWWSPASHNTYAILGLQFPWVWFGSEERNSSLPLPHIYCRGNSTCRAAWPPKHPLAPHTKKAASPPGLNEHSNRLEKSHRLSWSAKTLANERRELACVKRLPASRKTWLDRTERSSVELEFAKKTMKLSEFFLTVMIEESEESTWESGVWYS